MMTKEKDTNYLNDAATNYLPVVAIPGEEIVGSVIGGADWCEFYLRPDNGDTTLLGQINDQMHTFYEIHDVPPLKSLDLWRNDVPCAAQFAKDKKWYRARLEDTYYNLVRFVDYGNRQMCAVQDIKPLLRHYADVMAPSCIRCTLTEAQDVSLPSFVSDDDKVKVTILGVSEPYEVAVQILSPSASGTSSFSSRAQSPISGASASRFAVCVPDSWPGAPAGISTTPQRSGARFDNGNPKTTMMTESMRPIYRVPPTAQQTKYNIQNAGGIIADLCAESGWISLVSRPASLSEIDVQQSSFCGGPLLVDDLRRIFRVGERVRYSAKHEQSFVSQEMERARTAGQDNDPGYKKPGRWLVVDFKPHICEEHLITHAVVTFVGESAVSLYIRGSEQSVWAPRGIFPERVALFDRPLRDLIDVGRSVIVRAVAADQLADFKFDAEWIAQAVELVGQTYEEHGFMYLVRDNYSVIITEDNDRLGHAFVANRFVDSAGLPMEEWYGTKVVLRSCADVPDSDRQEFRYGIRMKALRAQLIPDGTKGPYRYPGIYRPSPIEDPEEKSNTWVDSEDELLELPMEAIKEMDILGVDVVGIERTVTFYPPEGIEMVRENLQNELYETTQKNAAVGDDATGTKSTAEQGQVMDENVEKARTDDQEDDGLVSTVEIILEPFFEPVFLSVPPLEPVKTPIVIAAKETLTNGDEDLKKEMEDLTTETSNLNETSDESASPGERGFLSVACQTAADADEDEEERLEQLALAELLTAAQSESALSSLMACARNLEGDARRRFFKVFKLAMTKGESGKD